MKNTLCILMLCLLVGCGKPSLDNRPFIYHTMLLNTSTISYTIDVDSGWEILQPPMGQWRTSRGSVHTGDGPDMIKYLPEHFPARVVNLDVDSYNFFYAHYNLSDGKKLVAWVRYPTSFTIKKREYFTDSFFSGEKIVFGERFEPDTYCIREEDQGIIVSFNNVDVVFDSGRVSIHKDDDKFLPIELKDFNPYLLFSENEPTDSGVYNLSDQEIIKETQPVPSIMYHDFTTFIYRFLMGCRDLEDAVLVIEGLSCHGEPIPPLRVRMNYYDYSIVPAYDKIQADYLYKSLGY